MSDEKEPIMTKINNAVINFIGDLLGEKAKETVEEAQKKIKDLSSDALKNALEMTDSVIETLKLEDNEQIKEGKQKIEDFLKEQGLLKEE